MAAEGTQNESGLREIEQNSLEELGLFMVSCPSDHPQL